MRRHSVMPAGVRDPKIAVYVLSLAFALSILPQGIAADSPTPGSKGRRLPGLAIELGVFHEGLMIVPAGDWWHSGRTKPLRYVDANGRDVFGESFRTCYRFHEGVAVVEDESGGRRFIDRDGRNLTEGHGVNLEIGVMSEGLVPARWRSQTNVILWGWGYADAKGKRVIDPKYEAARSFREGLAAVCQNEKWGYIDKFGAVRIDFQYDEVRDFSEGIATVRVGDKWGCINHAGEYVLSPTFDELKDCTEGAIPAKNGAKWGSVDPLGNIVVPIVYEEIGSFSEGLARARVKETWGFVDHGGKAVIPFCYANARDFKEGVAVVGVWPDKERKTLPIMGYLSRGGNFVVIDQPRHFSPRDMPNFPEGILPDSDLKALESLYMTPTYKWIGDFSEGLATVVEHSPTRVWIIDRRGRKVARVPLAETSRN